MGDAVNDSVDDSPGVGEVEGVGLALGLGVSLPAGVGVSVGLGVGLGVGVTLDGVRVEGVGVGDGLGLCRTSAADWAKTIEQSRRATAKYPDIRSAPVYGSVSFRLPQ